jgi:predicted MFS family arabinose efflux permease
MMLGARGAQGVFGAMLAPALISTLTVTFTEPRERGKAFGIFGAVASSGAVTGLLLGGALTEYAGWRWCLFVNVLVAGLAMLAGRAVLPADRGYVEARVDALSGGLVTAGLAGIVFGCAQAAGHGWRSWQVLGSVLLGATAVALFLRRQARTPQPLLPLRILADRNRAGAYLAAGTAVVGAFGMFLMLTYHFQEVLGYSPVRAGLAFLPMSAAVSLSAYGLGSRLLPRVPPRLLIVPGLAIAAVGMTVLSTMTPASGWLSTILPAEVLLGVGMGLVFTPAISVATSGVEPRFAGVAAATANTAMQIGGSIGTAVLNSVAVAATSGFLSEQGRTRPSATAVVHGFAAATTWSAVALAATAAASYLLIRNTRDRHPQEV